MTALLAVTGLVKRFGAIAAVDGVGFALGPGERVALIGPNGAGKSTCFALIGGQLAPDAGRVTWDGTDMTGRSAAAIARAGIGRTFQIAASFASLTARESVETALLARDRASLALAPATRRALAPEADDLLATVGLDRLGDRVCAALAYGDVKRLELALALALRPRLLLMDEPTAGVGGREGRALMALIDRLVASSGLAVLFTEHDMDVVFGHADRVLVLERGRLIADGPPDRVRADPQVRASYLGAEP